MTGELPTDIRAVAFFPSDHAAAIEGKVFVNGGFWNRLSFPSYPQVVPAISLVAVLEVPWRAYLQDHSFSMAMQTADGEDLGLKVEGNFRVGASPEMKTGDPTIMPIAVVVNNLSLQKPGDYSFVLNVDGGEVARYPVRAVQTPQLAPTPGGTPPAVTPPEE